MLCSSLLGNSLAPDYLKEAKGLDEGRGTAHPLGGLCSGVLLPFPAPGSSLAPPTCLEMFEFSGPLPRFLVPWGWSPGGSHRVPPLFKERPLDIPHSSSLARSCPYSTPSPCFLLGGAAASVVLESFREDLAFCWPIILKGSKLTPIAALVWFCFSFLSSPRTCIFLPAPFKAPREAPTCQVTVFELTSVRPSSQGTPGAWQGLQQWSLSWVSPSLHCTLEGFFMWKLAVALDFQNILGSLRDTRG